MQAAAAQWRQSTTSVALQQKVVRLSHPLRGPTNPLAEGLSAYSGTSPAYPSVAQAICDDRGATAPPLIGTLMCPLGETVTPVANLGDQADPSWPLSRCLRSHA